MDYFPEEGLIKCIDGIRRDESRITAHCTSDLHPHGFYYLFYVSDKFIDLSDTVKALHKEFHVRIFLRKIRA